MMAATGRCRSGGGASRFFGPVPEHYLRKARGYGAPIPATLGFLPPSGAYPPAMIAAFGMATEPEPGVLVIDDADVKAVQLIKLKPDGGGKADVEPNKIIIGKGALGSPIVLAPPNDLLGLAICEGVEDALSVHEATGLGAWASGGATRMPALAVAVPDYIDLVIIVADRDPAGVKGTDGLADGLRRRGIKHRIAPLEGGRPHEAR
jgi:Toprim domain